MVMPDHARYLRDKDYYVRYNQSPERKAYLRVYIKDWYIRNIRWKKLDSAARRREKALLKQMEKAHHPKPARKPLTPDELLALRSQIFGFSRVLKREEDNPGSARMRRRKRTEGKR